jgi:hypothetical protein
LDEINMIVSILSSLLKGNETLLIPPLTLCIICTIKGGEKEKKKGLHCLNWILKEFSMTLAEKSNWKYLRYSLRNILHVLHVNVIAIEGGISMTLLSFFLFFFF